MKVLRFIFANLDQFRYQFYLILVIEIISAVATFLIPVILSNATTHPPTLNQAWMIIIELFGLYAFGLCLQWVIRNFGEGLAFQFGNHIRAKYFNRIEQVPIEGLQKYHSGYLLSLVNTIGDGLDQIMFELPSLFAGGSTVLVLFFYFTARQSLIIAVGNTLLLIIFVVIGAALSRQMVPIVSNLNQRRATLLASYADFMANLITVKKLGAYTFAASELEKNTQSFTAQLKARQSFHAGRWFLLHGLYGLAYLGTIAFLLIGIAHGLVTVSILILFVSAFMIIRGLMERASENVNMYMEMRVNIDTLLEVTGAETSIPSKVADKLQTFHELTFSDVEFSYRGASERVFIPEFNLAADERVAVVGRSGQGKSTFLNLLTNQLEAAVGERIINQQSYHQLPANYFAPMFAVVSQEVDLFNMSLRDNLRLNNQGITDSDTLNLLEKVGLADWLASQKSGLDTLIGEKGITLSAGQKQRLNLVRGLLLDRPIIILDEPTSHLDGATEELVVKLLEDALRTKTAIIVTHRPALLELCSRRYEFSHHRLNEVYNGRITKER